MLKLTTKKYRWVDCDTGEILESQEEAYNSARRLDCYEWSELFGEWEYIGYEEVPPPFSSYYN